MAKNALHIQATTKEELEKELKEAANILLNLQLKLVNWQTHYGIENKNRLHFWQEKANAWIEKHKIVIPDAGEESA